MKMLDVMKIPKKFNKDLYFNTKTNEVIKFEDVDDVLEYETDLVFEHRFAKERARRFSELENKLMHDYIYARVKDYFDILYKREYMKQRDALDFLTTQETVKPFDIDILVLLVKEYPKDYKEVIDMTLDKIKSFDGTVYLDSIESGVLDDETVETISETLSQPKIKELLKENYVNKMIKFIYLTVLKTDEYDEYLDKTLKELTPKVEEELSRDYDNYKFDNYDEEQKEVAGDIINLFDYVFDNKLISWIDNGKYITMVTSTVYSEDKIYFNTGKDQVIVNKEDIKEMIREGNTFMVVI